MSSSVRQHDRSVPGTPMAILNPMRTFITVVSGLPRSGTSLLMQMLTAGGIIPMTDALRQADEDNPKGYFEFERVKALPGDTAWLPDAQGKAVKVIHRLLKQLPGGYEYRVLFAERALDEVLASQGRMLARLGKAGGALPPERLKAIFQQEIDRVLSEVEGKPGFHLLRVPHARLIQAPMEQAARINAFLGGGLDEAAMAAVVDPALHRNKARSR